MNQANSFRALLCVLAAALAFAATPARAQTYPTRPVRVILPFAAGGIADITTRVVAERLGDRLGQRGHAQPKPLGKPVFDITDGTLTDLDAAGHALVAGHKHRAFWPIDQHAHGHSHRAP